MMLSGVLIGLASPPGALAAPSVAITSPVNGELTNNVTPKFTGTGEDGSGPVTLRIYAGAPVESNLIRKQTVVPSSGTWSVGPVAALADGLYTATASQTKGETGISAPVSFTVLTTAPVVTLEQAHPSPGDARPSFAGTASDPTKGIAIEIHEGESEEGTVLATATAAGTGAGWHSGPASSPLAVGRYTAVAIQESSLIGNPAGRSAPMIFDVLPALPPAPAAAPASGVKALAQAAQPKLLLMSPFPVVRVTGVARGAGTRLRLLSVQQAPAGALVRVRCHGHGCPRHGARRTTIAGPHGVPAIAFRSFERYLRAGAVVEVLITKPGTIGKYTRLRIRRGRLPERLDECLDASGARPIACPPS